MKEEVNQNEMIQTQHQETPVKVNKMEQARSEEDSQPGTSEVQKKQTRTQTQATQTHRDIDKDEAELSAAEECVFEDFNPEVGLRNGKYFVKKPFYSNVEDVPENFDNAMVMMDRVHQSLQRKNMVDKYTTVFQQQISDGIIEEIRCERFERASFERKPFERTIFSACHFSDTTFERLSNTTIFNVSESRVSAKPISATSI